MTKYFCDKCGAENNTCIGGLSAYMEMSGYYVRLGEVCPDCRKEFMGIIESWTKKKFTQD